MSENNKDMQGGRDGWLRLASVPGVFHRASSDGSEHLTASLSGKQKSRSPWGERLSHAVPPIFRHTWDCAPLNLPLTGQPGLHTGIFRSGASSQGVFAAWWSREVSARARSRVAPHLCRHIHGYSSCSTLFTFCLQYSTEDPLWQHFGRENPRFLASGAYASIMVL